MLGLFISKIKSVTAKKKTCRCCEEEYPTSWFFKFVYMEKRNESPVFFKGKWHLPTHSSCKTCKKCSEAATRTVA